MKRETLYKYFATIYFVIMSLQIIIIEGVEASVVKFALMIMSLFFFVIPTVRASKFFFFALGYIFSVFISATYYIETFRLNSFLYLLFAVIGFVTYCNLLYTKHIFSIDDFIKLLKFLFIAYVITLILQQIAKITFVGYGDFPLLNIYTMIRERTLFAGNSLSLEPSHFARIIAALYLSLLRMYECKLGKKRISLKEVFTGELKWYTISFIWSIFSMGSGTAIIAFLIILLYFLNKKSAVVFVLLFFLFGAMLPMIQYEPIQRAYVAVEAAMTLDSESVSETDMSASARILPFIYTIENFNLYDIKTWIGNGMGYALSNDHWRRELMIGGMSDYGFISYLFAIGLIYTSCLKKIFSIETLFIIVLLMAEIRNVYLWWFIFMAFASTKYFSIYQK